MNGDSALNDASQANSAIEVLSLMDDISSQKKPTDQPAFPTGSPDPLALHPVATSFFRRAQLEMASLRQDRQDSEGSATCQDFAIEDLVQPAFLQSESTLTSQERSKDADEARQALGDCDGVQPQSNGPEDTKNQLNREIGQLNSESVTGSSRATSTPLSTPLMPLSRLDGVAARNLDILAQAVELEVMSAASVASPTWDAVTVTSPPATARHRTELDNDVEMDAHDDSRCKGGEIEASAERSTLLVDDENPQTGKSPLSQDSPPTSSAPLLYCAIPLEGQTETDSFDSHSLAWPVYFPYISVGAKSHSETSSKSPPPLTHEHHCPGCARPDLCEGTSSATSSSSRPPQPNMFTRPVLPCGCPLPVMVPAFHQHHNHHPIPHSASRTSPVARPPATINVYHDSHYGVDQAQSARRAGMGNPSSMVLGPDLRQKHPGSYVTYRAGLPTTSYGQASLAPSYVYRQHPPVDSSNGQNGGVPINRYIDPLGAAQTYEEEAEVLYTESDESDGIESDGEILPADGEVVLGRGPEIPRLSNTAHLVTEAPECVRGSRCSSCPPSTDAESQHAQAFVFGRLKLDKSDLEKIRQAREARASVSSQEQSSRWWRGGRPYDVQRDVPGTRVAPSNLDWLTTADERKDTEAAFRRQTALASKQSGATRRRGPMKLSERVREKPPVKGKKQFKSAAIIENAEPELEEPMAIKKRQGKKRGAPLSDADGEHQGTLVPAKRAKKAALSLKVTSGRRKPKTFWTYVSEESSPEPSVQPVIIESRLRNGRLIAPVLERDSTADNERQPKLASKTPSTRPRSESTVTSGEVRPIAGSSRGRGTPVSRHGTVKPATAPRASFTNKAGKFVVTMPKGLPNAGRSPEPEFTLIQPLHSYMNPKVPTSQAASPPHSPAISSAQGIFSSLQTSGTWFSRPDAEPSAKQSLPADALAFHSQIEHPPSPSVVRSSPQNANYMPSFSHRQTSEPTAATAASETFRATRTIDRRGRIKRKGHVYLADMDTIIKKGTKQLQKGGWEYVPEDEYESALKEPVLLPRRMRRGTAAL